MDKLDPMVQHHIVNTLGWRELRELQDLSIEPILRGAHCLLLAPTAGGKTEAALLPVLSRMCAGNWPPLSVLYVCPLKALLNNLATRLDRYTSMVGRRSAVWHGDVPANAREKIRREPPDILLTTPESLEVMLVSSRPDGRSMLSSARTVIVDEIHAFAGDDRGWHLLALLERICRIAGREIQRIGLSATVGDPKQLLNWFAGHCDGERVVTQPRPVKTPETDVTVDFVGSLSNAAIVISRLHRGQKRLVFCDSRSQVEELTRLLRQLRVQAYASHSSLSAEDRRTAEAAFAEGADCVIVATSTLELGIDVGDLDRVIQVDAPNSVASFLQRLGRTGRREGLPRNCLFLATSHAALLRACAIVSLWRDGFVESPKPPPEPLHVLAQQLMALALQLQGVGRRDWEHWIGRLPVFAHLGDDDASRIVEHLLQREILFSDGIRLALGDRAQEAYGRRHFLELLSVFTTPPLLTVLHGRRELGQVDQLSVASTKPCQALTLSLGGRSWRVELVDWKARRVFVVPGTSPGRTSWLGQRRGVPYVIARSVHRVLTGDEADTAWSERAGNEMRLLRNDHSFLRRDVDVIVREPGHKQCRWYTMGGDNLNVVLSHALEQVGIEVVTSDDCSICVDVPSGGDALRRAIRGLDASTVVDQFKPPARMAATLKFGECLPEDDLSRILRHRFVGLAELKQTLGRRVVMVTAPLT